MLRTLLMALTLSAFASTTLAEEYRGIFWNLESGDSSASQIATQMVAKGSVDFWGLSEVASQSFLDELEQALEAAHSGVDFIAKLSEEGAGDRLAILYRADRLRAVPYSGSAPIDEIGDAFFEVDSINVGGTIRPGLGVELESPRGDRVIVLVNHWKCCGGEDNRERREKQAIQMNGFAIATPDIPIVAGGDFNIPLNRGGQGGAAFAELAQLWEYKEPTQDVGTHRGGTILDAVFVTHTVPGWSSTSTILQRNGNSEATTPTFFDNASETDHRPLLLVVQSDPEDRLQGLREAIADLEATLQRMRVELERLEAHN